MNSLSKLFSELLCSEPQKLFVLLLKIMFCKVGVISFQQLKEVFLYTLDGHVYSMYIYLPRKTISIEIEETDTWLVNSFLDARSLATHNIYFSNLSLRFLNIKYILYTVYCMKHVKTFNRINFRNNLNWFIFKVIFHKGKSFIPTEFRDVGLYRRY